MQTKIIADTWWQTDGKKIPFMKAILLFPLYIES
jgi:hypothetical protein